MPDYTLYTVYWRDTGHMKPRSGFAATANPDHENRSKHYVSFNEESDATAMSLLEALRAAHMGDVRVEREAHITEDITPPHITRASPPPPPPPTGLDSL